MVRRWNTAYQRASAASPGFGNGKDLGVPGFVVVALGRWRIRSLLCAPTSVYQRESSDNPMLNAFWRVAPSVRLSALAIFLAGVFFLAMDLRVPRCCADHATRLRFFAIQSLPALDRLLQLLGGTKRNLFARLNLDCFTRGGIASHARGTLAHL
jgi:hypothetical protein